MQFGAKTITALTLLIASASTAALFGRLRADYLAQLDLWAGFAVGVFAVLAANAVFHFARLGERSEHHLRIGPGGSPRVEHADPFGRDQRSESLAQRRIRSGLMRLIYIAIFLQIGLVTIDNRGVALLASLSRMLEPSRHGYCLEDAPPKAEDPRLAGCGLLRRAYKLGYADDLGPCAPREQETVDTVCDRRQLDEPYLHYAWRLLNARRSDLVPDAVSGVRTAFGKLEAQRDHLADLLLNQHDSITQAPRSSHHLFTNLPPPRAGAVRRLVEAIDVAACDERTVNMAHLLDVRDDPRASSLIIEHAMGQLLFNPAYPTVVASCREYTIHWGSSADACDDLVANPHAMLERSGVLGEVEAVVDRHARARLAWRLAKDSGRAPSPPRPPDVSRIVSFQCLTVARTEPGPNGHRPPPPIERVAGTRPAVEDRTAVVRGHRFSVRHLRIPAFDAEVRDQIRVFKHLSRLLAPAFTYGKLQSEESLADADAGRAAQMRFSRPSDLLTKLELLRETDIFIGHQWLDRRPDLLAVYPYHVHLTNFVEAFRRHYQHARSRL